MDGPIYSKSFDFALRIVNLKKYLNSKREYDIAKQILRSGTSIGANVAEARQAQSRADFITKMSIALKEASETDFWLSLLYRAGYLTESQYNSLAADCNELNRLLTSIIKSSKE